MKEVHYKTSDGNVFYTENAALNHAKSLKDRSFVYVAITGAKAQIERNSTEVSVPVDYETLTKSELIIIAKKDGIEISSKKTKAQIIEQINHAKSK